MTLPATETRRLFIESVETMLNGREITPDMERVTTLVFT